jgi:hypothetical protein
MRRATLSLLATIAFAACGGGGGGTPSAAVSTAPAPQRRGNPSIISESEIAATNVSDAYQVVEKLRPNFLHSRGATTLGNAASTSTLPIVYVDEARMGDPGSLRQVPISQIKEIRLLSAADATMRWGTGVPNGVILVVTKGK